MFLCGLSVCSAGCLRPYVVDSDDARVFQKYALRGFSFPLAWLQPAVFPHELASGIFGQNRFMEVRALTCRLQSTGCACLCALPAWMWMCTLHTCCPRDRPQENEKYAGPARAPHSLLLLSRVALFCTYAHSCTPYLRNKYCCVPFMHAIHT